MENTQDEIARLSARIAALEAELARYAARYGLTDGARRLMVRMDGIEACPELWSKLAK